MCKIICVTNRKLCRGNFLERIERIASAHPYGIILREKDLEENAYKVLAEEVKKICERNNVRCILHSFRLTAEELGTEYLHMPLPVLRQMKEKPKVNFLGVSCHSVSEVHEAVKLGADYVIAGHIFETDCKKGLSGRGLEFLHEVCGNTNVPVYAIGGISAENANEVIGAGAEGICIMSSIMQCESPKEEIKKLRSAFDET